jgi:hypothetical protein
LKIEAGAESSNFNLPTSNFNLPHKKVKPKILSSRNFVSLEELFLRQQLHLFIAR